MPPYCSFSIDVKSIQIRHSWFKIISRRPFRLYSLTRFLKQKLYKNTKKDQYNQFIPVFTG